MRINEVYKPIVWYIAIVNDVYQPIYKLGGPHKAKWFRSKTGFFPIIQEKWIAKTSGFSGNFRRPFMQGGAPVR